MNKTTGVFARAAVVALLIGGAPIVGSQTAGASPTCTGTTTITCAFEYNGTTGADGSPQTFTVPAGITSLTIDAFGAEGSGQLGGSGGHEGGTLAVTAGQVFEVRVGGSGATDGTGGYNGGGRGIAGSGSGLFVIPPDGGGGTSDVRPQGGTLADRIVTAGGGGGYGGSDLGNSTGGLGGGGNGGSGTGNCGSGGAGCGQGATDIAGGAGGTTGPVGSCTAAGAGTFGSGGAAFSCPDFRGGGGGGGWWGGGGGAQAPSNFGPGLYAGGGGSGHVAASVNNKVEQAGVQDGPGQVRISYMPTPPPVPKYPTGPVSCSQASGIVTQSPKTITATTKQVKLKIALAAQCVSNAVGGKAPITDVAMKATLTMMPDCTTFVPLKKQKVQFKWQGRNASNKLTTVATTNTTAQTFVHVGTDLALVGTPITDLSKAFPNQGYQVSAGLSIPLCLSLPASVTNGGVFTS